MPRKAPTRRKSPKIETLPKIANVPKVEIGFHRNDLVRQTQWMLATACGLAFIPVLHNLLRPLVAEPVIDQAFLAQTFLLPAGYFLPEPLERLTYLLATLLVPLVMLAVLRALKWIAPYLTDGAVKLVWMGVVAGFIAATIAFAVRVQTDTPIFREFFPFTPHPSLRICLGLILAACALLFANRISKAWAAAAFVVVALAIPLAAGLFSVTTTSEGPRDYLEGPNLDAVIYSLAQVMHGRGLLIDTPNQYGLYPQFLEPLFRVIGLSVLSFTLTMWVLLSASFVCLSLFLWKNTGNKWVAPLALLSVAHYGYFSSRTWLTIDPYPQYHPLRFLFPCLGLYLFSRYIRRPSATLYYGSLVTASLALFWNPDSGVAVFGAWIALLAYREFSSQSATSALRAMALHIGRALTLLLSLTLAYSGYALLRYHAFPQWGMLTVNVPVFYKYGGMMLPMPSHHPWLLVIAIYVLTFARAGYSLLRQDNDPRRQLQLVTAVLGVGLFTYYQGRSHDNNLTMVIWPAIVLLALYADELMAWRKRAQGPTMLVPASVAAYGALFLLCFPIILIPDVVRAASFPISVKFRAIRAGESGPIRKNVQMLQRYFKPGQAAAILSFRSGVYHAETGTASAFTGPGFTEMLWRSQLASLEKQIAGLPKLPLFIDFQDVLHGPPESFFPEWATSLARTLTLTDQNLSNGGTLAVFRQAANSQAPVTCLFPGGRAQSEIAHVHGGAGGVLMDEKGHFEGFQKVPGPPLSARKFTIEVLVRPEGEQVPWATIVSTHPGSANNRGFVLHHFAGRANSYSAVFGNDREWRTGPEFTLPPKVTSYLCVVLRNEEAHVYVNGDEVSEFKVPGGIANSEFPISVGDWETMGRPFNGKIIELRLSRDEMTASEIADRWKMLRPKIK